MQRRKMAAEEEDEKFKSAEWTRRWKFFFAVLVIVGFCWGEIDACPARCQCDLVHVPRTISCTGLGLHTFPDDISDVVEILDLSGNLLTELPPSVDRLTELQQLNLARNKLSSLPSNLRGWSSNLRKLDLSENALNDVRGLSGIGQLVKLKALQLQGNPLTELDGLKNPAVQYLNADSCGIKSLKNTSLFGLPELTYLSLSGNTLKDNIKDPYSSKLKGLDLSKCQLEVLSPRAFQGFPELIDLRLADNPSLVYSTRFQTLRHQKLQKIDVSRCNLDRPGLHGLPSLISARLSSNNIEMLPDHIFEKNRELTHLFLDSNRLERLNKSTFSNLLRLQVLDLSSNNLVFLPSVSFRDNVEMQFLNLSDNDFTEFPKISSSVISLDLSSNFITCVDPQSLIGTPRLYHLNLSKNLIEEMPNGLDSSSLRNLILKRNRIHSLGNISMSGLPELEKLDLSGNQLKMGISPEIFFDNPNLHHLYLQDNPWECVCSQLYPTYSFLKNIGSNADSHICHSPHNFTGYSWKSACATEWKNQTQQKGSHRTWGLILVSVLTTIVLLGTIVSVRHSMKLKRQARNHRLELERAEVRERLRLLQRRSMQLQRELREHSSEPRIHPLELIEPPTYEEAVTMQRLARSLDGLDSVTTETNTTTIIRMTGSSESLRSGKKRRTRKVRRLRSQSEDNLTRRELRREERLRRIREPKVEEEENEDDKQINEDEENEKEDNVNSTRLATLAASRKKSKKLSAVEKRGTSTDDEDSDIGRNKRERETRRIGRTIIRNLDREPRSGYRPSTDGES